MEDRTVNSQTPHDAGWEGEWPWGWLLPRHRVEEIWSQNSSTTTEMRNLGPGWCCLPELMCWALGQIAKLLQLSSYWRGVLSFPFLFLKSLCNILLWMHVQSEIRSMTQKPQPTNGVTPGSPQTPRRVRSISQCLCLQFLSCSVTLRGF